MAKIGNLFVVAAPSGAGKHTILRKVLEKDPNIEYSISATTRAPREGEIDGTHYFFIDRTDFEQRVARGEFVEWAEVHGNLYGTLRTELAQRLDSGKDIVLELDVQGMRNLVALYPDAATVFIMAPSIEILAQRLRKRGANTDEDTAVRLKNARDEIAARHAFQYIIINDELDKAVADMEAIIRAQRCRSQQQESRLGMIPRRLRSKKT